MTKKANNEGSIYKDKKGLWRGAVTLYCENGVPKRKYLNMVRLFSEKLKIFLTYS